MKVIKAKLQSALDSIQTRQKQEKLDAAYQKAVDLMEKNLGRESIEAADQLKNAGEQFKALGDYQDSKERSTKCFDQEKECRYNCASHQFETARYKKEQHEFEAAAKLFATIPGYKDADELVHKCQKEGICAAAMSKMNGFSIETYDEAIKLLEDVRGYYDEWCNADDLLETCHNKKTEILHSQEEERLELQRREQQRKAEAEIAARKRKKLVLIIAAAVVLFASAGSVITFIIIPNNKYKNAVALMDSGNYPQALAVLKDLGEYKDSDDLIQTCQSAITNMVRVGSFRHSSITYKLKLNGGDIKAVQGDSGHAQASMVTEQYAHILDDDRRLNAQRFDDFFYQHQGAEPEMPHQTAQSIPENSAVDADAAAALTKLLANPSMAELIKNLAKNL